MTINFEGALRLEQDDQIDSYINQATTALIGLFCQKGKRVSI